MLNRSPAALLIALAACVTGADEPTDEAPFRGPVAEAETPVLDQLTDPTPIIPQGWRNQRPRPGVDVIATAEDAPVKVDILELLANDMDPDGGRVVFAGLGTMSSGRATVVGGEVVFEPDADFAGVAWFDYVVSDGRLQAAGRVRVMVAAVNDAPIAFASSLDVMAGDDLTFRIDAFDPEGDALVAEVVEAPSHGTLTGDADKYRYQPDPSWAGVDHLTYRVSDGAAWSEPVTIDLIVTARE